MIEHARWYRAHLHHTAGRRSIRTNSIGRGWLIGVAATILLRPGPLKRRYGVPATRVILPPQPYAVLARWRVCFPIERSPSALLKARTKAATKPTQMTGFAADVTLRMIMIQWR